MQPETPARLWDALDAARKAVTVAHDHSSTDYMSDWLLQSAVERQLEIIGEALKNVRQDDPETASLIPDIHAIVATRNILAHAYTTVDPSKIWQILIKNLPELIAVLEDLLRPLQSTDW